MRMMRRTLISAAALLATALPVQAQPQSAAIAFPPGFLWGAATAAHQIEGSLNNDWVPFEAQKGVVDNGDTSTVGCDSYHRFDEDFALAEGMGHNAERISFEWARIEPKRGQWDWDAVDHYHSVLASMRRHGLKPLVTLHHFTNPTWVAEQGGWLSAQTILDFAHFAAFVGREFGAEVDDWVTINEPNVYAFHSFDAGDWPPQHHSHDEALSVMANMARGHAAAYKALHASDRVDADEDGTTASVGIAQHLCVFEPYSWWNPLDQLRAHVTDDVFNRSFLRAVTSGELRFQFPGAHGVNTREPGLANTLDFIGVNYYSRWLCTSFGPEERVPTPGAPVNALGWEIYPEGLYRVLQEANGYAARPDGRHIPLYVTENGIDDRDGSRRAAYLVQHLAQVGRAIHDGMDVRGYMHWTLMDNFEWTKGYAPHFGLYAIDRRPGHHLARVPTPAVGVFRTIASANGLTEDVLARYGTPQALQASR